MDTTHPPSGSRHHHSSFKLKSPPFPSHSLRPFSNQLPAYTAYAYKLLHLRSKAPSVRAMTRALRERVGLRRLRLRAQLELQNVYDHVAFGLALPRIPVRLPLRKRIHAAGFVRHTLAQPLEIRIFTFVGCLEKPRRLWKPVDLGIHSPAMACEILLHEVAHVHQGFHSIKWDHDESFVGSYEIVEEVFLGFGFGPLLPHQIRFGGCPPGSAADSLQGTARPNPLKFTLTATLSTVIVPPCHVPAPLTQASNSALSPRSPPSKISPKP